MQNIKIDSGSVRLTINDDPARLVEFNPNDVGFVERFYSLMSRFEEKEKEYAARIKELSACEELDAFGIPKNMRENLALLQDACTFMREQIDFVFGAGTSMRVFGNMNTLDMFEQFLNGIVPHIQAVRTDKVVKYTGNRAQRRAAGKVMK